MTVTIEKRDAFDALADMDEDVAHAAVVDYPWEFDTANGTDRFGHDATTGDSDLYRTLPTDRLETVFTALARVVHDDGWVFVFADDQFYPAARCLLEESPAGKAAGMGPG